MRTTYNFIRGAGSVLNIAPRTKNKIKFVKYTRVSPSESIRKDFEAVGRDLWTAIKNEQSSKQKR